MVRNNNCRALAGAIALVLLQNVEGAPGAKAVDGAQCWSSWSSYDSTRIQRWSTTWTTDMTDSLVFTSSPDPVPTSVFCDGIPRKMAQQISFYTTVMVTTTPYETQKGMQDIPEPTCFIPEDQCVKYAKSEEAASSSYLSTPPYISPTAFAHCSTSTACPAPQPMETDPACAIDSEDVTVYYWPQRVNPSTLCPNPTAPKPTTVTPAPTGNGPNKAVIKGITMTSPSLYISMATVRGRMNPSGRYYTGCGRQLHDIILSIPQTAVSTRTREGRHYFSYVSPSPFDVRTLNWPITTSISCTYNEGCDVFGTTEPLTSTCYTKTKCSTPTVDPWNFNPYLDMPSAIKTAAVKGDPGYAKCGVHTAVGAVWVPITPLPNDPRYTATATAAGPPSTTKTSSASPVKTAKPSVPTATSTKK